MLILLAAFGAAPSAWAVQDTNQPETPASLAVSSLELSVLPMRRAELEAEVSRWLDLVQQETREHSAVELALRTSEDDARTSLQEQAAALGLEKAALIERARVVVTALKEKGGDVEEYEKYLDAVSGVSLDVTDTGAVWTYLRTWLRSPEGGIEVGLNIVRFVALLIIFWVLARILGAVVSRAVGSFKQTSSLLRKFLTGLTRKATLLIGVVVAVSMLGVNIGPLVAAIGAAGLVIGFALQGTLSNFASGIMILLYRPYDVGDFVSLGGVAGTVESMTLVSTTVRTPDNQTIIVPNNAVWNGVITNVTGRTTRRVDLTFGISYRDDIDRAMEVLAEILKGHPMVLDDPEPLIRVSELADSSVNFIVRPWTKTEDYWTLYWDLTAEVKRRFDHEGIGIPFPQMDVHVHKAADATPPA